MAERDEGLLSDDDPPFDHGAQAVPEHSTPPPSTGRSAGQMVVIAIGALVLIAALLWILVPILG